MLSFKGFDLSGFELSKETLELIRKQQELHDRHRSYRAENADCARQYVTDSRGGRTGAYYVPALRRADEELRELEAQAIAESKPLPDREEFMVQARARVAEYERLEPALAHAVKQAEDRVTEAIKHELPALASQGFAQSEKAKKEYIAAVAKAETARAKMQDSVSRFLWAVSGGELTRPKWRGFSGQLGDEINAWQTTPDGKLTYQSAWDLGLVDQYQGNRAECDGFIAPPDEDAA
ncbi:hypothetical protein [Actinacidiphila oryziradicis]|uniref:hypothetical protein n=1 Tax=Actinacidiphila oryziradicis TaxID=2571141 RepID=UPI0023F39F4D|nr:hypothetical protein [Actinacidiphila oryziradicis]MCW2873521.1 hypothetical protein [Actinacidiphila oryziradicis]